MSTTADYEKNMRRISHSVKSELTEWRHEQQANNSFELPRNLVKHNKFLIGTKSTIEAYLIYEIKKIF